MSAAGKRTLWRRKSWIVGNLAFALGFGAFNLTTGDWWGTASGALLLVLAGWWLHELTTAEPQRRLLDGYQLIVRDYQRVVSDQAKVIVEALTLEARRRM